ncbi:MAG: serine/threonine protein kinase [Synechococcaceae cyanobacterium SM2_3_1]|nr:serine/threonine protein kinase [Synechococcaceae cyanobacterium SM2_3_1]
MRSSSDPFIGQQLAGRYRLIKLLGQGAMGRVYLAQDQQLGQVTVAVKLLFHSLEDPKAQQRFEQEARAGAYLGQKSLHIVRVQDYGLSPAGQPFYVMEYLQGESLADRLRQQGALSLQAFLPLARQIGLGLKAAHDGLWVEGRQVHIVHRDLKPSNIQVIPDESLGELVKVLDFGIAKLISSNGTASLTQAYVGTLAYSSPEQLEGIPPDPCSDIYSLGILFFEMLTGRLPIVPTTDTFPGWYQAHHKAEPAPLHRYDPSLPVALSELILDCLAKDRRDRPQTMAEILERLQSVTEAGPLGPRSGGGRPAPQAATAAPRGGTMRLATSSSGKHPAPAPIWIERGLPLLMGGVLGLLSFAGIFLWLKPDPGRVGHRPAQEQASAYASALQAGQTAFQDQDYAAAVQHFQMALSQRRGDQTAEQWLQRAQQAQSRVSDPGSSSTPNSQLDAFSSPPRDLARSPELLGSTPIAELTQPPDSRLRTFPVNTAQISVRDGLGQPHDSGSGQVPGTRYDRYWLQLGQGQGRLDLGLVYDEGQTLRQTEVTVNAQVPLDLVQNLLGDMLQTPPPPDLMMKLQQIREGSMTQADFQFETLQGRMQLNAQGNLYISTWDPQINSAAPAVPVLERPSRLEELRQQARERRDRR